MAWIYENREGGLMTQSKKNSKSPYQVLVSQYVTEKAMMLQQLQSAENNPSVARCKSPKYVFLVHPDATKPEIAKAVEVAYADRNVSVVKVNTLNGKRKQRRLRGRRGFRPGYKKAIVTLREGDAIEDTI